jgi:hypothetical protein
MGFASPYYYSHRALSAGGGRKSDETVFHFLNNGTLSESPQLRDRSAFKSYDWEHISPEGIG